MPSPKPAAGPSAKQNSSYVRSNFLAKIAKSKIQKFWLGFRILDFGRFSIRSLCRSPETPSFGFWILEFGRFSLVFVLYVGTPSPPWILEFGFWGGEFWILGGHRHIVYHFCACHWIPFLKTDFLEDCLVKRVSDATFWRHIFQLHFGIVNGWRWENQPSLLILNNGACWPTPNYGFQNPNGKNFNFGCIWKHTKKTNGSDEFLFFSARPQSGWDIRPKNSMESDWLFTFLKIWCFMHDASKSA